ncbi:hypothetical protein DFP95_13336 [Cohnella lupini]|uniref:Uncharacterized protein n=1 Tax=Cohnella lupini TaxID=1294267 RepID=A0A3D9HT01_9BACL|nr:hypothetical protein DFP95_13336 [Cohnella lupini]
MRESAPFYCGTTLGNRGYFSWKANILSEDVLAIMAQIPTTRQPSMYDILD